MNTASANNAAVDSYDVWAPRASRLRLVVDGSTVAMRPRGDGWWQPESPIEWRTGVDYGYLIDDSETPLPDPRSRRQPSGVHALSRTFDPAEYAWNDTAWTGRELRGGLI